MNEIYERDLDLNLLRVFLVVADSPSVTAAAQRLYLTQSAVSAALRRLTGAVGTTLFVRQGRGLVLSARGQQLLAQVQPHLLALVEAARAPARFDPTTSTRCLRLGLSDASEAWLLPALLQTLAAEAPAMQIIVHSVQFRTVADALASRRIDVAVTVADDLPSSVCRQPLFSGGFVCVFDSRAVRLAKPLTAARYFAYQHVIVSYNGDLRGVVEDMTNRKRKIRCSVPSFSSLGAILDGSRLLATVPAIVAKDMRKVRPHLRTATLPFQLGSTPTELLWPRAADDDPAGAFVRARIQKIAHRAAAAAARL